VQGGLQKRLARDASVTQGMAASPGRTGRPPGPSDAQSRRVTSASSSRATAALMVGMGEQGQKASRILPNHSRS
jgi:hypothetical protein